MLRWFLPFSGLFCMLFACSSERTPETTDSGGDAGGGRDSGMMTMSGCGVPANAPCDGIAGGPEPLNEHVAAYFDDRQEMVVFGGNTAVPVMCGFPAWVYNATTWIYYDYDNECGSWTRVDGNAPSARGRHAAGANNQSMWVFGGRWRTAGAEMGAYTVLDDLWRFDISDRRWTKLSPVGPTPPGRYNTTLTWADGKLWLFAGNSSANGGSANVLADFWSYDPGTNAWTQNAVAGPTGRMWHTATWDPSRNWLLIFGGGDNASFTMGTYRNDLWAYDITNDKWTQLSSGGGVAPAPRFWGSLVEREGRYVLFGGHDSGSLGNRNDLWQFDVNQGWSLVAGGDTFSTPSTGFCMFPADFANVDPASPERRNAATLLWSERCERAVLFGGKTDCGAINDVWHLRADNAWDPVFASGAGEVCARANGTTDGCAQLCF